MRTPSALQNIRRLSSIHPTTNCQGRRIFHHVTRTQIEKGELSRPSFRLSGSLKEWPNTSILEGQKRHFGAAEESSDPEKTQETPDKRWGRNAAAVVGRSEHAKTYHLLELRQHQKSEGVLESHFRLKTSVTLFDLDDTRKRLPHKKRLREKSDIDSYVTSFFLGYEYAKGKAVSACLSFGKPLYLRFHHLPRQQGNCIQENGEAYQKDCSTCWHCSLWK